VFGYSCSFVVGSNGYCASVRWLMLNSTDVSAFIKVEL
jgi:hypothetical protein